MADRYETDTRAGSQPEWLFRMRIEQDLRRYADCIEIRFHRVAVRPEQIIEWSLPTRPTKKTDSRAKGFADVSVELDAIDPDRLRSLVQECIEQHLPQEQYRILKVAEESERELLQAWAGALGAS